jgi:prepilin peptidase CpaA
MSLLFYYLMPFLLVAGFYDIHWRRIPNALTLPLAAAGLLLQMIAGAGLLHALVGVVIGGGLFFLFYGLGMMGAGDVKLMAAVSAWLEWPVIIAALLLTMLAGGLLAMVMLARQHVAGKRTDGTPEAAHGQTLPYGVAIAMGSLLSLFIVF